MFFDTIGMAYEYEPEGFELSDGTLYLPDFYLPASSSFFEVKGVMDRESGHKIKQFIKEGQHLTVGYPDMTFDTCDDWWGDSLSLAGVDNSYLCECVKCGGLWFMGIAGFYGCRCCGEYDGDGHFVMLLAGDGKGWHEDSDAIQARLKAKQARFEHGETPVR